MTLHPGELAGFRVVVEVEVVCAETVGVRVALNCGDPKPLKEAVDVEDGFQVGAPALNLVSGFVRCG